MLQDEKRKNQTPNNAEMATTADSVINNTFMTSDSTKSDLDPNK